MIRIDNLYKSYKNNEVLKNVTLHIPNGCIYGLVGRSGAGKSTLLRCINGLEQFQSGELLVDGVAVKHLSDKNIREFRKEIGVIFQHFSLLERLSVYDNVALPMRCWKYNRSEIDKKVRELLELVGIPEKIRSYPNELSGGQKQRVAIARALTMNPKLLLCDEATSALDPKSAQTVTQLLNRINKELGITIVVVTHQMSVLRSCCEQIAILENGRVEASGDIRDIFLQQPPALVNLIGRKTIPFNHEEVNLRIVFVSRETQQPVLTKMARELNIDFSIIGGEMNMYQSGIMGTIHISIPMQHFSDVSRYLKNHNICFQVVESDDSCVEGKV